MCPAMDHVCEEHTDMDVNVDWKRFEYALIKCISEVKFYSPYDQHLI